MGLPTPQQKLWLLRNHEFRLAAHFEDLSTVARRVVTCRMCNARQVLQEGEDSGVCEFCAVPRCFTRENNMSIGKYCSEETALNERSERMRLFTGLGNMTVLELNLVRAILPRKLIYRLNFRGTGQFGTSGHAIGLDNKDQVGVAKALPNAVENAAIKIICDRGENYKKDPAMYRKFLAAAKESHLRGVLRENMATIPTDSELGVQMYVCGV